MDYMRQKRVDARELESVGLVIPRKSGDGFYDRFRNRLMFTITDQWGNPIAFSGRALDTDSQQQGAKYINSPETREYTKGKVLYGLYQARVPMSKSKEVILVEGNFDVVSMTQAGIANVVAPLGTALTSEQAELLRRRVERAVIMFDGDRAGRVAAARAFPILAEAGIASYTAPLPINEDPDSVIRSGGLQTITNLLKNRMGLLDQIISDAASQSDGSVQDIASRIEKMRPFIKAIRIPLEADLYRKKIAQAFHVDLDTVFRTLRGERVHLSRREQRDERQEAPGRVEERELVVLLLCYPALWEEAQNTGVISLIYTATIKQLLEHFGYRKEKGEASVSEIISLANQMNLGAWLSEQVMANPYNSEEKARKALVEIGKKLAILPVKEQIEKIEAEIRLADSAGDDIRVLELSRQKAVLQGAQ
jgi:DNA primase